MPRHKRRLILLIAILIPVRLLSYTDEKHFSMIFNEERHFRIFTPPDYSQSIKAKRYPVIYFFHGCGGNYKKSGTFSYADYGLSAPLAELREYREDYEFPNNADFENFTMNNNVIIVCADGKIDGLDGCGVYFPSLAEEWNGNFYNFSLYARELINVVDSMYNTLKGPAYRAISGLSMGGHMAVWIAAANPHLFSSASQFCHSPNFYITGNPDFATTVDLPQLWRNLSGLPFRHSTTTGDYIRHYTRELYCDWSGAGFENLYYCADFCNHHAARIDLQFGFHMDHFGKGNETLKCFSFMNLYPDFEIRDYMISGRKKGNGWTILQDVTYDGLMIMSRERLPWGKPLPPFDISITTPPCYEPGENYSITRYSCSQNTFSSEKARTDTEGRLKLTSKGGTGEILAITGKGIQPAIMILPDTINENIYLENQKETPLSFDIVNLSDSHRKVEFIASTENTDHLVFNKNNCNVTLLPRSRRRIESMFICTGSIEQPNEGRAFLRINMKIDGTVLDREHFIPVIIKKTNIGRESDKVTISDGRTMDLKLFRYGWQEWFSPVTTGTVSEGKGNGNGKAEKGEIFSIWLNLQAAYDSIDVNTWHPVVPVNFSPDNDVSVVGIVHHTFSTGRAILSAIIKLNRMPTADSPVVVPVRTELLRVETLKSHCHRPTVDGFLYSYYNIIIKEDGSAIFSPESDYTFKTR